MSDVYSSKYLCENAILFYLSLVLTLFLLTCPWKWHFYQKIITDNRCVVVKKNALMLLHDSDC